MSRSTMEMVHAAIMDAGFNGEDGMEDSLTEALDFVATDHDWVVLSTEECQGENTNISEEKSTPRWTLWR